MFNYGLEQQDVKSIGCCFLSNQSLPNTTNYKTIKQYPIKKSLSKNKSQLQFSELNKISLEKKHSSNFPNDNLNNYEVVNKSIPNFTSLRNRITRKQTIKNYYLQKKPHQQISYHYRPVQKHNFSNQIYSTPQKHKKTISLTSKYPQYYSTNKNQNTKYNLELKQIKSFNCHQKSQIIFLNSSKKNQSITHHPQQHHNYIIKVQEIYLPTKSIKPNLILETSNKNYLNRPISPKINLKQTLDTSCPKKSPINKNIHHYSLKKPTNFVRFKSQFHQVNNNNYRDKCFSSDAKAFNTNCDQVINSKIPQQPFEQINLEDDARTVKSQYSLSNNSNLKRVQQSFIVVDYFKEGSLGINSDKQTQKLIV